MSGVGEAEVELELQRTSVFDPCVVCQNFHCYSQVFNICADFCSNIMLEHFTMIVSLVAPRSS